MTFATLLISSFFILPSQLVPGPRGEPLQLAQDYGSGLPHAGGIFGAPAGVTGDVAFDAFGSDTASTSCPLTWTHTPVGTPAGALVWVVQNNNNLDLVTTVTYGGDSMTEVAGSPILTSAGEQTGVHAFFLGTSIPTGAQTISVTCFLAPTKQGTSYTVTASTDTVVQDTSTIESSASADPSVNVSLGGVLSFVAIGFMSGQNTPNNFNALAGWTEDLEVDLGPMGTGTYSYDTIGTADVSCGWEQNSDDANAICIAVANQ